jgi:hypothetical protein
MPERARSGLSLSAPGCPLLRGRGPRERQPERRHRPRCTPKSSPFGARIGPKSFGLGLNHKTAAEGFWRTLRLGRGAGASLPRTHTSLRVLMTDSRWRIRHQLCDVLLQAVARKDFYRDFITVPLPLKMLATITAQETAPGRTISGFWPALGASDLPGLNFRIIEGRI